MPKLALAATFAIAMLTSFSSAPTQAQVQLDTPCGQASCPQGGSTTTTSCGNQLGALKRVMPAEKQGTRDGQTGAAMDPTIPNGSASGSP